MKKFELSKNHCDLFKKSCTGIIISALSLGIGAAFFNSPTPIRAEAMSDTAATTDDNVRSATSTDVENNLIYFSFNYNGKTYSYAYDMDDNNVLYTGMDGSSDIAVNVKDYRLINMYKPSVAVYITNDAPEYDADGVQDGKVMEKGRSYNFDQEIVLKDGTTLYQISTNGYVKSTDVDLVDLPDPDSKGAKIDYSITDGVVSAIIESNLGMKTIIFKGNPGDPVTADAPEVKGYTVKPAKIQATISSDGNSAEIISPDKLNYQNDILSNQNIKIPGNFKGEAIGDFSLSDLDPKQTADLVDGKSVKVSFNEIPKDGITYATDPQEVKLEDGKLVLASGAKSIDAYISKAKVHLKYVKEDTGGVISENEITTEGKDSDGDFVFDIPSLSTCNKHVLGYEDNVKETTIKISRADMTLDKLNQTVKIPAVDSDVKPVVVGKNYFLNDRLYSSKIYTYPDAVITNVDNVVNPEEPNGANVVKIIEEMNGRKDVFEEPDEQETALKDMASLDLKDFINSLKEASISDVSGYTYMLNVYFEGEPQDSLVTVIKDVTVKTNLGDKTIKNVSGKPGTSFTVDSPKVTGYTADPDKITVNVSNDGKEITTKDSIKYTKVSPAPSTTNHSSHSSRPTNTNGQIKKLAQTVATFADRPDVAVNEDDMKPIENVKLSHNSDWFSDEEKTIDGTTYYRVATDEWVKNSDIYVYVAKNQIVRTNNKMKYISLVNAHGNKITNRALAPNTNWKTDRTTNINGKIYYRVATNEFVAQDLVTED
ncbi:SLAP domain-containing protein [Companilactobacillus farciminis]|uniref:SLAP domain-containing protein n=1 Tax=Companilactobacillus farciminis TaxID=1612 RepID=UPI0034D56C1F